MSLSRGKATRLKADDYALSYLSLQEVEDTCRLYSAYAWLGYRLPEFFPDIELAQELSRHASERVDSILQEQNAVNRKRNPKRFR